MVEEYRAAVVFGLVIEASAPMYSIWPKHWGALQATDFLKNQLGSARQLNRSGLDFAISLYRVATEASSVLPPLAALSIVCKATMSQASSVWKD